MATPISAKEGSSTPVDLAAAAEEQREAEHEQQVADHRAGQRAADDLGQSLVDRDQRDDQLGRVAEGGVQEAADARAGVLGRVLGRLADQPGQRDQRERGEGELERLVEVGEVVQQDRRAGPARGRRRGRAGPRPPTLSSTPAWPSRSAALPENGLLVKSCGATPA